MYDILKYFNKYAENLIFFKKNLDILFSITYILNDALDEMKEIAFYTKSNS